MSFDMAISNFEGPAQAIDGFAKFCSKVRKEITPYLEAYNKEQKAHACSTLGSYG